MGAIWLLQAATPTEEIAALHTDIYAYFKLIVIFGLVLVLVFFVLRIWLPRLTGVRRLASGPIKVIARYPLEPRKNLYIVLAAGSYFLIGTSETGVHYLTPLEASAIEASLPEQEPVKGVDFAKLMQSFKRPGRTF